MRSLFNQFRRFLRDDNGPTAVEYAFMLGLILLVCIVAIRTIGSRTNIIYQEVETELQ